MKTILFLFTLACVLASTWFASPVSTHEQVNTTVSFDKEIVRILSRKCVACHSEGNLGMPLTTYEQTRPWARAIEEEVLRRHMPPWRALAGYGEFANEIGLTNRELSFIVAWVEGNGPKTKGQALVVNLDQGKSSASEQLKTDFNKWSLGKPDLRTSLPSHSSGDGAGGSVRREVVDLGLTTERWVRAIEFKPGDRRVVRAAFFSLQGTGQWLASWTPWYGITTLPNDVAYKLRPGARIVAELYYGDANAVVNDQGSLGLYFAPKPPANSPADLVIETTRNGGEREQKYSGSVRLPSDSSLLAFKTAIQPGIDSIEVSTRKPDGAVRVLLLVRGVLPQWPTPYVLKTPVRLAKDSELRVTYYATAALASAPTLTASVFSAGASPAATQPGS